MWCVITIIVPAWASHRCVSCTQCGATSAGLRCEWQNNYTQCAPCASLASCPLCQQDYNEEEIILQCRQCDRWAAVQHSGSGLCLNLLVCLDSFQLSKSLPSNIIKPVYTQLLRCSGWLLTAPSEKWPNDFLNSYPSFNINQWDFCPFIAHYNCKSW